MQNRRTAKENRKKSDLLWMAEGALSFHKAKKDKIVDVGARTNDLSDVRPTC
jgi:hypothetical protein